MTDRTITGIMLRGPNPSGAYCVDVEIDRRRVQVLWEPPGFVFAHVNAVGLATVIDIRLQQIADLAERGGCWRCGLMPHAHCIDPECARRPGSANFGPEPPRTTQSKSKKSGKSSKLAALYDQWLGFTGRLLPSESGRYRWGWPERSGQSVGKNPCQR